MHTPFDHEVAIVGAGPAGIGVAVALERLEVDYVVLERDCIGASFRAWPAEMRLLTPSFPANAFGVRDLNAITPDTAPALALDCEHPTGEEYADYLEAVAEFHEVPVRTGVDVERVVPGDDRDAAGGSSGFTLETNDGSIRARFVVWAAGEYQYPATGAIAGAERAVHVSTIDSWSDHARRVAANASIDAFDGAGADAVLDPAPETAADGGDAFSATDEASAFHGLNREEPAANVEQSADEPVGDDVIVVGGAESGIDAALGLAEAGLSVTVLDEEGTWQYRSPDPSEVLSPRTTERLEAALAAEYPIDLVAGIRVDRIERLQSRAAVARDSDDESGAGEAVDAEYVVVTNDGDEIRSRTPPVLATGFEGSLTAVDDLFDVDDDGPSLTDRDESATTPGLFLAGPAVTHDGQQFCFIYKFRQRFAVVAETIGDRLGVDTDPLEEYREKEMVLEDLDCCEPDYCDC
ncbi:NAD(P)/FAD-dependent oxidoreductase [Halopiger goleimassiliensis]|uniref:NAD(P)/FAD-dependent oxidoreductase n=1 Tax=Halopiger goleimassiliensis TaxID=1293048 RepID=UPI000677BF04|nr:NAD(P)/FAD-dependent oxidoreductase [Halopiger goleimassiliensis]